MEKFEISNATSGLLLGTYEAADEDAALDAMARDAGYKDYTASVMILERPKFYEGTDADWLDVCRAEMVVVKVA